MDGIGTVTWETFVKDAEEFMMVSKKIDDSWEFVGDKTLEGMAYLSRQVKTYISCKLPIDDENNDADFAQGVRITENRVADDPFEAASTDERPLITLHHVLWSLSYGVPVLYFNGWKSDFPGCNPISVEEAQKFIENDRLDYTELSQSMHPILNRPFLQLHPCKSQELIKNSWKSKNKLVSWLSVVAPAALRLPVHLDYFHLTVDERTTNRNISPEENSEEEDPTNDRELPKYGKTA